MSKLTGSRGLKLSVVCTFSACHTHPADTVVAQSGSDNYVRCLAWYNASQKCINFLPHNPDF